MSPSDDWTDVPIYLAEAGASLPSPDEARVDVVSNTGSRRRWVIGVLTGIAVLAVVLGVSIGVFRDDPPPRTSTFGRDPSKRAADQSSIVHFLVSVGISSRDDLEDRSTAQAETAEWLAERDPLNVPLPDTSDAGAVYSYTQRYVVALLWHTLDGGHWNHQFDFLSDRDVCLWTTPLTETLESGDVETRPGGVYCYDGKVSSLHFDANNLRGSLPKEIAYLTSLKLIAMNNNEIKGGFLPELCQVKGMRSLGFAHNQMTGELPACLSEMTALRVLILSNNEFEGALPDFSALTDLQSLLLDDNHLMGDISTAFNALTSLRHLYLEDNAFSGTLNDQFLADAKNLELLDISDCGLKGTFPVHLMNLPSLWLIDMHGNKLSGELPADLPANTMLRFLAMHQNEFAGEIPSTLAGFSRLTHLDMSSNYFSGAMPDALGDLTLLNYLFLADNDFQQGPIPTTYSNLVRLQELSLKSTLRDGELPAFFGDVPNLVLLDLGDNKLSGSIPTSWGEVEGLKYLLLNRNQKITGQVPASFSQLKQLRSFYLESTNVTGTLASVCELPMFNAIDGDIGEEDLYQHNIFADCDGESPRVECDCCVCCETGSDSCNLNNAVASLNPEWESAFARLEYEFNENGIPLEERQYFHK